jgi:hypothetical protein
MSGITSKSYFATLNIIYFAILAVMVGFSVVALVAGIEPQDPSLEETFKIAVPGAVVIFFAASYFVYNAQLQQIRKMDSLKSKLSRYQAAVLIRAAPIEAAGLFGAVATLLTGEIYFLGAPALSAIVFVLQRPTPYSVVEELALTHEEKSKVENPNEIVADRVTNS